MLTLNNVATQDGYVDACTLGPVPETQKIAYLVANNAAVIQLAGHSDSKTIMPWGTEILVTPTTGEFQRIQGIRFRSAVAGAPARIVAQLVEPEDPVPVGGTPFTQQLSASGNISSNVIIPTVLLAAFPPAAPVDGQAMAIILPVSYDQATNKTMRWLVEYDATNALWWAHGGVIVRVDSTHTFGYTGGGAGQDPSSVLTNVVPVTVPRPGLYRVRAVIEATDTNVGGGHDAQVVLAKNGAAAAFTASGIMRTDSQGGIGGAEVQIEAEGMVLCNTGDNLGMLVSCGVNGINFTNAVIEITPMYLT